MGVKNIFRKRAYFREGLIVFTILSFRFEISIITIHENTLILEHCHDHFFLLVPLVAGFTYARH